MRQKSNRIRIFSAETHLQLTSPHQYGRILQQKRQLRVCIPHFHSAAKNNIMRLSFMKLGKIVAALLACLFALGLLACKKTDDPVIDIGGSASPTKPMLPQPNRVRSQTVQPQTAVYPQVYPLRKEHRILIPRRLKLRITNVSCPSAVKPHPHATQCPRKLTV